MQFIINIYFDKKNTIFFSGKHTSLSRALFCTSFKSKTLVCQKLLKAVTVNKSVLYIKQNITATKQFSYINLCYKTNQMFKKVAITFIVGLCTNVRFYRLFNIYSACRFNNQINQPFKAQFKTQLIFNNRYWFSALLRPFLTETSL
jgi:hypothetical protein